MTAPILRTLLLRPPLFGPLRVALLAMAFLLAAAAPAAALDLNEARSAGLVGERRDGSLGIVTHQPGVELRALVDGINAERTRRYQAITARNSTAVADVAAIAGSKLIARAAPGHYVEDASGHWVRQLAP